MVKMIFFRTGKVLVESKLICTYLYMLAAYSKVVSAS